jgi:hypothetical protein
MAAVAGLYRREVAGVISAYAGEGRPWGGLGIVDMEDVLATIGSLDSKHNRTQSSGV